MERAQVANARCLRACLVLEGLLWGLYDRSIGFYKELGFRGLSGVRWDFTCRLSPKLKLWALNSGSSWV